MIYITGDTHGDISCFKNPKLNKLGEKDILIVCGDFGFIWNPHDKNEKKNLEFLKKRKYTICFVDGAHENFDILNSYKPYRWKGGNTHKIADNIYHLMRGELPSAEDMRNGVNNIRDTDKNINYVITYEPPTVAKDILKQRSNQNIIISPLNTYLQQLMENVQYMHWYFGSLHLDLNISKKMTAVFNEIIQVG